eukprot:g15668.t1
MLVRWRSFQTFDAGTCCVWPRACFGFEELEPGSGEHRGATDGGANATWTGTPETRRLNQAGGSGGGNGDRLTLPSVSTDGDSEAADKATSRFQALDALIPLGASHIPPDAWGIHARHWVVTTVTRLQMAPSTTTTAISFAYMGAMQGYLMALKWVCRHMSAPDMFPRFQYYYLFWYMMLMVLSPGGVEDRNFWMLVFFLNGVSLASNAGLLNVTRGVLWPGSVVPDPPLKVLFDSKLAVQANLADVVSLLVVPAIASSFHLCTSLRVPSYPIRPLLSLWQRFLVLLLARLLSGLLTEEIFRRRVDVLNKAEALELQLLPIDGSQNRTRLADQQREVWAQNLDVAFQQILRRHAGSRRTTSLEEKLLRGSRNGPAQPSESQPSESSISTELFRAAEIRGPVDRRLPALGRRRYTTLRLVMLLDFEMSGRATGSLLGMNDGPYWTSQGLFRALGITFDVLFTVELALRIAIEGYGFVKESSIRAVRMLRAFRFSQGLKLLLNACQSFITSLCWSMVLLGVVMVVAIWRFYGTAYRSWYTLYEITFAGNWPTMARPVLDKVNHGFVVFFVLYITIIVFALIRVITAVFLKDTLDAANNDAELRMAEGLRKKAEYVEKLEGIFQAIDDTGDGMITEERLTFILDNPKVKAYFQTLDVDVHEGAALFHILDDGDGECTLEETAMGGGCMICRGGWICRSDGFLARSDEFVCQSHTQHKTIANHFIGGILRCKGPARAIDQVAMMADLRQLDKKLSKLIQGLHDAQIVVINESGEMPRPISKSASNSQHSSTSMEVTKTQSRRRASEAAQSFLYKTSMLPKLKHAGTASLGAEETFVM